LLLFASYSGYNKQTIRDAFAFYVKVYSNLRLKDLCRKYNSRLHKTTTVGLRQSLACKRGSEKKRGKGKATAKKRKRRKQPEPVIESEEDLHSALVEIAEEGVGAADDEREDVDNEDNE
jgi:hypothetical protein